MLYYRVALLCYSKISLGMDRYWSLQNLLAFTYRRSNFCWFGLSSFGQDRLQSQGYLPPLQFFPQKTDRYVGRDPNPKLPYIQTTYLHTSFLLHAQKRLTGKIFCIFTYQIIFLLGTYHFKSFHYATCT